VYDCQRILRHDCILHVMSPWRRQVNAVADPTNARLVDVQTIKGICRRAPDAPRWCPLHAACDGAAFVADLRPFQPGDPGVDPVHVARFFD
jgi:hypothetical protein